MGRGGFLGLDFLDFFLCFSQDDALSLLNFFSLMKSKKMGMGRMWLLRCRPINKFFQDG